MLNRRPPPPPPLLRPRRRTGRLVLAGFGLLLGGAAGGLALGLSLRPPASPIPPPQARSMAAERPGQPPDPPAAQVVARDSLLTEVEALRRTIAAEQAQLAAVVQARAAAAAQLAQAQREAEAQATRREAAAPAPPALPRPAPRPESAPRAEPAPAPAAPSQSQPRVVLHHRAGSAMAAEAAADLAATVRASGFDVEDVQTAAAVPSQRVVRYYHSEDAPIAARLAGRLGRGWAIQDFRAREPAPPPGTLEVWLPER